MEYTFYGDLLGVSGYYRLSPQRAYDRLNDFYNVAFSQLRASCAQDHDRVWMFSDSLLITGRDAQSILTRLQELYLSLARIGLLLRGAMVRGRLRYDPRLTLTNFEKRLPKDDTLARAVGIEKSCKGARLLIESAFAEQILQGVGDWRSAEGYFQHILPSIPIGALERRICPTPDNRAYELLYFWPAGGTVHTEIDLGSSMEQLIAVSYMVSDDIRRHYIETKELMQRCNVRREFTERKLGESQNFLP